MMWTEHSRNRAVVPTAVYADTMVPAVSFLSGKVARGESRWFSVTYSNSVCLLLDLYRLTSYLAYATSQMLECKAVSWLSRGVGWCSGPCVQHFGLGGSQRPQHVQEVLQHCICGRVVQKARVSNVGCLAEFHVTMIGLVTAADLLSTSSST